jgi:hypothetical protein
MKIKISLQQFLPLSETEIQGLLNPAEANLWYFLAWFQSLQLPSTQSESPLALIPRAPKSHVSFEVCTQLWTEFSFFIFRSGLTVTGLARVYCTRVFTRGRSQEKTQRTWSTAQRQGSYRVTVRHLTSAQLQPLLRYYLPHSSRTTQRLGLNTRPVPQIAPNASAQQRRGQCST